VIFDVVKLLASDLKNFFQFFLKIFELLFEFLHFYGFLKSSFLLFMLDSIQISVSVHVNLPPGPLFLYPLDRTLT
jgi:hypothetical protein